MKMRTLSSVARPKLLSRALDDLSAIASVARSAPRAGDVALARADRLEKRLAAVRDELKGIDKRLAKANKRIDGCADATKRLTRVVERLENGVDAVAASTQSIEPKLGQMHRSVHPLAGELVALRDEVGHLAKLLESESDDGAGVAEPVDASPTG